MVRMAPEMVRGCAVEQTPALQTFPEAHSVSSGRAEVSLQTGVPVVQACVPARQSEAPQLAPGLHAAPAKPRLKCVTCALATPALTVACGASYCVLEPSCDQ